LPTNFPTSLDAYTDPTGSNNLSDSSVLHHTQHANANDAIVAIETWLLPASKGGTATNGTYAQLGSGAKTWVDVVANEGADPTGVADATTAINNAITAIATAGGTVYFPPGTYLVSGSLIVPSGVRLLGAFARVGSIFGETLNASVIKVSGNATFDVVTTNTTVHGLGVESLFFDVNTDSSHWVINAKAVPSGLVLRDIGIRQSATGANGIQLDGGSTGIFGALLDNVSAACGGGFTGGVALRVGNTSACNANTLHMVEVLGYTTGIDFNNGGGNTLLGPWLQSCTTGIRFNSSQCSVYGGWHENNTTGFAFTAGSTDCIVIGGRASGLTTTITDAGTGNHAIDLDGYAWGTLTGGAVVANGNGSSPGITFFDRTTGSHWQWYGNTTARLNSGSSDVITLDTSGNVTAAGQVSAGAVSATGVGATPGLSFADRTSGGPWQWYGNTTARLYSGAADVMLVDTSGRVEHGGQVYPGAEALGLQTSGGLLHATGVPSNSNGNNNDWCISDNGHMYFKSAGSWVQKV
jgi:Pectate lyase superfamily protein